MAGRATISRHAVRPVLSESGLRQAGVGVRSAPFEVKKIVLADGELAEFDFVTVDEAAERVTPLLARRIVACLKACEAGTVVTLENGSPVT